MTSSKSLLKSVRKASDIPDFGWRHIHGTSMATLADQGYSEHGCYGRLVKPLGEHQPFQRAGRLRSLCPLAAQSRHDAGLE